MQPFFLPSVLALGEPALPITLQAQAGVGGVGGTAAPLLLPVPVCPALPVPLAQMMTGGRGGPQRR